MTSYTSATLFVRSERQPAHMSVHVTGRAPNSEIARFRQLLADAVPHGPEPLVFDLSNLENWEDEAQVSLLHLVTQQRHDGRPVTVTGLRGPAAQQAERSGIAALLSDPIAPSPDPSSVASEEVAGAADATTVERIGRDRRERRATVNRTCALGHPVRPAATHCDQDHPLTATDSSTPSVSAPTLPTPTLPVAHAPAARAGAPISAAEVHAASTENGPGTSLPSAEEDRISGVLARFTSDGSGGRVADDAEQNSRD